MAEINQHIRSIGIKEGSTWGTAVQVDSKLSVTQFSLGASKEIKTTANHNRAFRPGKLKAGRETVDFSASGQASFGEGWLLLYSMFAGAASIGSEVTSGQGDYPHNLDLGAEAEKFFTVAYENEDDTVHEASSVVLGSFGFNIQENEPITWTASGMASNKAVTGAATTNAQLNALTDVMTCPDEMAIMNGANVYARIAAYSTGTALSSAHDVLLQSCSIQLNRARSRRYGVRGAQTRDTLKPFQSSMFEGTAQIVLAQQDDAIIDLFDLYKNQTPLMMEIFVDGTQIGTGVNSSLKFQIPYLTPQTDNGSDGVQGQTGFSSPTLSCRIGDIGTDPAGMTGLANKMMRVVSVDERATAYTS